MAVADRKTPIPDYSWTQHTHVRQAHVYPDVRDRTAFTRRVNVARWVPCQVSEPPPPNPNPWRVGPNGYR